MGSLSWQRRAVVAWCLEGGERCSSGSAYLDLRGLWMRGAGPCVARMSRRSCRSVGPKGLTRRAVVSARRGTVFALCRHFDCQRGWAYFPKCRQAFSGSQRPYLLGDVLQVPRTILSAYSIFSKDMVLSFYKNFAVFLYVRKRIHTALYQNPLSLKYRVVYKLP